MTILGLILLGIGAIAGGAIGGYSAWAKDQKAIEDAQFQQGQLSEANNDALDLMDLQFEEEKKAAERKADQLDKTTTLSEGYLSDEVNNELANLSLQEAMETWQFNQAAIQAGSNTGNELASMAQSGVKNSTMDNAVEMEAAMNAQQLQLQEDASRANDRLNLANVLNGLSQNVNTFQINRDDANYTRSNYQEGGGQYALYTQSRQNQVNNFNRNWNSIQRGINDVKSQMGWDIAGGILTGTAKGATTAYQVHNFISNAVNYDGTNAKVSWS